MKIKFLGGVEGVTGSKSLLTVGNENYLVDYGLYQGGTKRRELNWIKYESVSSVSAVFLTHAHIDHSGLLPRLWKDGFKGKIYCTEETFKLCRILLADSAKIQAEDAEFVNKKRCSRHDPALPLYGQEEVDEVLKQFVCINYEEETQISDLVNIKFYWAGHILGSSFIQITCKGENENITTVIFSGDIGHKRNTLLNPPHLLPPTDVLVLESTYGDRLHPRTPAKDILEIYLNTILKRGGVAIVPAFSVGRTQDILFLIKSLIDEQRIPVVKVYMDGPLSNKANEIFHECLSPKYMKDKALNDIDIYPSTMHQIESVKESRALNDLKGPMIIISASGMIDGGRVVHHVKQRVTKKENGIIMVGFQPEGTKGRILLKGEKILRLHKEEFSVRASIFNIHGLSAHGDYLDIIEWLEESNAAPKLTIINHGEERASEHLKSILESQLDMKVTVAKQNEEFNLAGLS